MCINCGLDRFSKPTVKSNLDNMAIYVLHIQFLIIIPKITAILVSRSPGDTVTLECLESRYGGEGCISSKYDSLKINHFSHAPKSDVIDDPIEINTRGLSAYIAR